MAIDICKECELGVVGGNSRKCLEIKSSLCPIISAWPSTHLFTNIMYFSVKHQWPSSFFLNLFVYLFGCVGLQHLGSSCLHSFCRSFYLGAQAVQLSLIGLIAPQHGGSSFQDQTWVLCTGKQILNHWTTKVLHSSFWHSDPYLTSLLIFSCDGISRVFQLFQWVAIFQGLFHVCCL